MSTIFPCLQGSSHSTTSLRAIDSEKEKTANVLLLTGIVATIVFAGCIALHATGHLPAWNVFKIPAQTFSTMQYVSLSLWSAIGLTVLGIGVYLKAKNRTCQNLSSS